MGRKGEAAPSPCLDSWVSAHLVFSGFYQTFSLRPGRLHLLSRVGLGESPELCSSPSVQILLNYLPLERASWSSILAKQR